MQVSIIIVNYNVKFFVEQCLYSVLKAVKNLSAEIIVFDNNSTDGSYSFLKDKFSTVKFIWNKNNEGFSRANNLAAKEATGDYILFLNPDTIIAEDAIEQCLLFYKNTLKAGALGIKMIDGNGRFLKESKRGYPTPLSAMFKFSGLSQIFSNSKLIANYYLGHLSPDTNNAVPILSGAFLMVKTTIFKMNHGFDEEFFMYGEDIDLSFRIEKAGYTNYYLSNSAIIHFKGESTKKDNQRYVKLFYGAMQKYLFKHFGKIKARFYSFIIHIAIKVKAMLNLIKNIIPVFNSINSQRVLKPLATIIVGNEFDYSAVIELSKFAALPINITGRVNPELSPLQNCLGNINQLQTIIDELKIENIIFCINELSAKEIIELIQRIKFPINYCFHATGSTCVVGNSNKFGITECVSAC